MNRRKFLAFLGLAPVAPALMKIAPVEPEVIFTPFQQREVYFGPSLVQMILEQQKLTNKIMVDNLKHILLENKS